MLVMPKERRVPGRGTVGMRFGEEGGEAWEGHGAVSPLSLFPERPTSETASVSGFDLMLLKLSSSVTQE